MSCPRVFIGKKALLPLQPGRGLSVASPSKGRGAGPGVPVCILPSRPTKGSGVKRKLSGFIRASCSVPHLLKER